MSSMTFIEIKKRHRTKDVSELNKKAAVVDDVHFLIDLVEELIDTLKIVTNSQFANSVNSIDIS